ncbi:DNA-directed RNA polymerase III largest subunit [Aspergillus luchuensis]|uniref:DNA-directed RNA polymerase III largest subunit n=1 Tax=Aspergillus kawachii TaxID=1069201 RepID=A0A146FV02_ASPKA|nr:DNA-directed RNA polymerase III largest subunit [Aspergillus luchuensis]
MSRVKELIIFRCFFSLVQVNIGETLPKPLNIAVPHSNHTGIQRERAKLDGLRNNRADAEKCEYGIEVKEMEPHKYGHAQIEFTFTRFVENGGEESVSEKWDDGDQGERRIQDGD